MGIFARLFSVGKAHANKAIEKMEDPAIMIDQAIRERKATIAGMEQKVAGVISSFRQLEANLNKERFAVETWTSNAKKAIAAGNDDLAKKALARKGEHQANADRLAPQVEAQRGAVDSLKTDLAKAKQDLESFEREKHVLLAQSEASKVKKDVYEARSKLGKDGSGSLMERMRAKTEQQAAEADALSELAGADTKLEDEFAELGGGTASIDDELAALKAAMP